MAKILTCGDPHTLISNLKDSDKLLDFIIQKASEHKVDAIEFTGDLFHNHALVRQEILHFWRLKLTKMRPLGIPVIIISGNHDMPGDKSAEGVISAISNFQDMENVITVLDSYGHEFPDGTKIGYCAYTSDHAKFLDRAKDLKKRGYNTLLAHQTFTGATYANGFFASDGIDPALVPQDNLIAGHIHSTMEIGKCFYVGAPKADNMADANVPKGVWILDHNPDGSGYSKTFISTEDVVTSYKKFKITEGEEVPKMDFKNKNYLELEGSNAWIMAVKKNLKGVENLQIKATPTDVKITKQKQNIKTISDFFANGFKPIDGVSIEEIQKLITEV